MFSFGPIQDQASHPIHTDAPVFARPRRLAGEGRAIAKREFNRILELAIIRSPSKLGIATPYDIEE